MGDDKILIYPKTKSLSAPELIKLRNIEIGSLKVGLKKTKSDGTVEETKELSRIYAELKKQLSAPRIERLSGRSVGEWDFDRNAVKVINKEGKFKVFGYFLNEDHYLENYEALFLLELNRLEILYNSVRMSIEQAYTILLGEEHSAEYNKYLVYSTFSRVGFIVQKYQNLDFAARNATVEDCIWDILLNSIQNIPISERVRCSQYFIETEKSMNAIKMEIINQETSKNVKADDGHDIHFQKKVQSTGKRKAGSYASSPYKRMRGNPDDSQTHKSFIDFLTNEEEYKRFEKIFQSFDIIRLAEPFDYGEEQSSKLDIQFDIYQHHHNFRKSEPHPPAFRLAILTNNQNFPNRQQISRCYHSQEYPVPVLLMSVSESKHIQAFLYHFT